VRFKLTLKGRNCNKGFDSGMDFIPYLGRTIAEGTHTKLGVHVGYVTVWSEEDAGWKSADYDMKALIRLPRTAVLLSWYFSRACLSVAAVWQKTNGQCVLSYFCLRPWLQTYTFISCQRPSPANAVCWRLTWRHGLVLSY